MKIRSEGPAEAGLMAGPSVQIRDAPLAGRSIPTCQLVATGTQYLPSSRVPTSLVSIGYPGRSTSQVSLPIFCETSQLRHSGAMTGSLSPRIKGLVCFFGIFYGMCGAEINDQKKRCNIFNWPRSTLYHLGTEYITCTMSANHRLYSLITGRCTIRRPAAR